jgi:hypothetical protein
VDSWDTLKSLSALGPLSFGPSKGNLASVSAASRARALVPGDEDALVLERARYRASRARDRDASAAESSERIDAGRVDDVDA